MSAAVNDRLGVRARVLRASHGLLLLPFLFGGCSRTDVTATEAGKKKGGQVVPVMMARAERKPMALELQAIGNVEPHATVGIKSRVDGQIVEVHYRDGQDVAKGQPLFQLDARPFQAQLKQVEANLLRDRAQLERTRVQEKRYKELLERNFVSADAYAQFATNAETAVANVRAAEAAVENARLQIEYTSIRSPIEGRAGKTLIQLGNMVKANDTVALVVINQVSPIYLNFAVPEQFLGPIRRAMAGRVLKVEALPTESGVAAQSGELAFIDNAVDAATGTVRMRALFPNRDRVLWPGQFATARLTLGVQDDAIVVPTQAVQTGPKGQYVYVVTADMSAQMRPVTVDRAAGEETVVASGLVPGETVVTVGQLRITPGTKVRQAGSEAKGAPAGAASPAGQGGS